MATHKVVWLRDKYDSAFLYDNSVFHHYRGELRSKGIHLVRRWWIVDKLGDLTGGNAVGVTHEFAHEFRTRDNLPYTLNFFSRGNLLDASEKIRHRGDWREDYIQLPITRVFASYVASYSIEELLYKGAFSEMTIDASLAANEILDGSFFLSVIEISDPAKRDTTYHSRYFYTDLESTKTLREAEVKQTTAG